MKREEDVIFSMTYEEENNKFNIDLIFFSSISPFLDQDFGLDEEAFKAMCISSSCPEPLMELAFMCCKVSADFNPNYVRLLTAVNKYTQLHAYSSEGLDKLWCSFSRAKTLLTKSSYGHDGNSTSQTIKIKDQYIYMIV